MKSTCQNFWRAAQFNASALSTALAQIKEQIRLNGGSDIKEEDGEPATSAKDVERSARLCERQMKNLPEAKLTGREKQKLNTQIDHLFKASDKLREYEKSLDILGKRNSYSKTDPDATFMRLKEDAMNNGQTKRKRLRIYTLPFIVKVLTFAP